MSLRASPARSTTPFSLLRTFFRRLSVTLDAEPVAIIALRPRHHAAQGNNRSSEFWFRKLRRLVPKLAVVVEMGKDRIRPCRLEHRKQLLEERIDAVRGMPHVQIDRVE